MGIKKLLTILDIVREGNMGDYKGKKVGIDGYAWIHRSIYNNGHEIVVQKDKSSYMRKVSSYFVMLINRGVRVCVVFDGDKLPSKQNTEDIRESNRDCKREMANVLLQEGNHVEANKRFSECIDVTPQLAFETFEYVKGELKLDVEVVVAPYEADAQLAYLSKIGYIDGVVTEDSDLLVFGAKRVMLKMNLDSRFDEIRLDDLGNNKMYSFDGWTHDQFIQFCIMCGCDYLKNLNKVGTKKAYSVFTNNMKKMKYVFNALRTGSAQEFNKNYVEAFEKAYLSFKYQRVFCPVKNKMVSLNSIKEMDIFTEDDLKMIEIEDMGKRVEEFEDLALLVKYSRSEQGISFLGPVIPAHTMRDISRCIICPISKERFVRHVQYTITDKSYNDLKHTIPHINRQQSIHSFFTHTNSQHSNTLLSMISIDSSGMVDDKGETIHDGNEVDDSNSMYDDGGEGRVNYTMNDSKYEENTVVLTKRTYNNNKEISTMKNIVEYYKLKERKSIISSTISNFRQSYLNTIRNSK